jgi:6-phosphogluconolactonase (cycloisomerase 2 family)
MFSEKYRTAIIRGLRTALWMGISCATTNAMAVEPQDRQVGTVAKVVPAAQHKCEHCGSSCDSGAVCAACTVKLAAQAIDGMVRVGSSSHRMMATNDMTKVDTNFVYTLDNDVERNGVSVHRRMDDGALVPLIGSPFNAGGKGISGGDIDEQGAIRVKGKYVLAVNPGSDSIAVFEKTPRGLLHVEGSPFSSNGSTPLSLAVHGELVYVANQAAEFANPKSVPNITGFRMMKDGSLSPIPGSTVSFPKGMGPAQVELSANGRLLAVTAGFQAEGGEGSRIYTFHVENGGLLKAGENSPIKPSGATGTVGFSISPQGDRLFVSTFKNSGVLTFSVDPQTAKIQQMGMAAGNDQRAACWTALTQDGRTLYVGNFVSNSISVYDVSQDGSLTLLGSVPRRGATNKDTKDIALSPDGRFLYAVGSGERQISIFKIESNRLLTELPKGQSPISLKTGQNITGLVVD